MCIAAMPRPRIRLAAITRFIAMLGYDPGVGVSYDPAITLAWLLASIASALAGAGSTTKLPWIRTPRRPVMCIAAMPRPRIRLAAITGAAFSAGAGIWSTHFIAMLGYDPGVGVSYDPASDVHRGDAEAQDQAGGDHPGPVAGAPQEGEGRERRRPSSPAWS
jgi:NO-binding membrane sensor protein with MHYT domain